MSKVGIWNGIDPGAARVDPEDRKAQNANYMREAQRFNLAASFGRDKTGLSPSLG
jgi:hypothetical protein